MFVLEQGSPQVLTRPCSNHMQCLLSKHRMAGIHIALLRVLRLKPALQATVTSPEFKELRVFQGIATVLLTDSFWVYLFLMCRALYAPMRVLRLADQKVPAMDKLLYFVRQTNRIMPKYLREAEHHAKSLTAGLMEVIRDEKDLASEVVDSDGDEDSEDEDMEEEEGSDEDDDEDEVSVRPAMLGIGSAERHWRMHTSSRLIRNGTVPRI